MDLRSHRAARAQRRVLTALAVAAAMTAPAACSDDEAPNDELLRIDGPAQVDPSFEGLDGRDP